MTREQTIAETAQQARQTQAPAPAPAPGKNRLPFIIALVVFILILIAAIIGSLIFFGVIPLGEPSPEPSPTAFNVLNPIAEFDECGAVLEARPDLYCNLVEIESDSTWSNSSLLPPELISEEMRFAEVSFPGANWIAVSNPLQAIEKVLYLPEGEIELAAVRMSFASSYPIASISINGESFYAGTNFPAWEDAFPVSLLLSRPNPDETTRFVNLRQFLKPGRNVIQFRFADESALPSPESTVNPEATVDPNATPVPPPTYALIAQIRIPVTGRYNSVQREIYTSNADWEDAPNVGFLPTATDPVMAEALWIQGIDQPREGQETVTVERVFYLPQDSGSFSLTLDLRNGTLSSIRIVDAEGNASDLPLPPSGGTTLTEGDFSFQRYEAIPFASGFRPGLNRLVVSYAPNSNVGHFIRLRMTDSEQESVFVSDGAWLRGDYRAESSSTGNSLSLSAPIQRGTAHLRGFVGIPNISMERSPGNVQIRCLQGEGQIPCASIRLRHENTVYRFADSASVISLERPERLFSLDLHFQSDTILEERATVQLEIVYVDSTGASQSLAASSVWYAYQSVSVITSANAAWTVVEDAAFINSANDGQEGEYISVFETSLPLPANAVVIEAQVFGSVDDHVLAIYLNDILAYEGNGSSEDFRQLNNFPIDMALLQAGENRVLVYSLNRIGAGAAALRFDIRYFSQRNP